MSSSITIKIPVWLDLICVWPVLLYRWLKYGYTFRRIYLGDGSYTILDQQDYLRLKNLVWTISGSGQDFYAVRYIKIAPGKTRKLYLHREIMNAPAGLLVDHQNSSPFDNRRANLRLATHAQNNCNKQKRKNTSSCFIGVYLNKRSGRWVSHISSQGKKTHLGTFDSQIDAAHAYDQAAKKHHGIFAKLNFPENLAPQFTELGGVPSCGIGGLLSGKRGVRQSRFSNALRLGIIIVVILNCLFNSARRRSERVVCPADEKKYKKFGVLCVFVSLWQKGRLCR